MRRLFSPAALLLGLIAILATSCGGSVPFVTPTATKDPFAGAYIARGGGGALDNVGPLIKEFTKLHPSMTWQGMDDIGSDAGVKLVQSGDIDLSFISRDLKPAEIGAVLTVPIGSTGTGVVVNAAVYLLGSFPGLFETRPDFVERWAFVAPDILSGDWWRAFSYLFIHANALHLLMNLGLEVIGNPSAIVSAKVGDEALARMVSQKLPALGVVANLVEFPAVAKGSARFRLQVMAKHTKQNIDDLIGRLYSALDEVKVGYQAYRAALAAAPAEESEPSRRMA